MSREIKFRAWDKTEKKMIDLAAKAELWGIMARNNAYDNKFYTSIWKFEDERLWPDRRVTFDNIVLMQYTGLTDKNGKEIYEGDIVKRNGYPDLGTIEYVLFEFVHRIKDNAFKFDRGLHEWDEKEIGKQFEVIGNIYANPELLNLTN